MDASSPRTPGPFRANLRRTPPILWVAVALLAASFGCAGGVVVSLHSSSRWMTWLLVGAAVSFALPGLYLAWSRHIMRDVD